MNIKVLIFIIACIAGTSAFADGDSTAKSDLRKFSTRCLRGVPEEGTAIYREKGTWTEVHAVVTGKSNAIVTVMEWQSKNITKTESTPALVIQMDDTEVKFVDSRTVNAEKPTELLHVNGKAGKLPSLELDCKPLFETAN